MSINRLNNFLDNIEDIISNNLISCVDICRNPKCNKKYSYSFTKTCDFLFVILDYIYKDLNKQKKSLLKLNLLNIIFFVLVNFLK